MTIKMFLNEISLIITDLEIGKAFKREILRLKKILIRYYKYSLSSKQKKRYKGFIDELKARLDAIKPYDRTLKWKIADLQEELDIIKILSEMNE